MIDKGCDNCYYEYFDEKAYPCSLCIRGIERTDQWQPCKKIKADTPQTDCDKCIWSVCNYNKVDWDADTPQTDCAWK